MRGKVDVGENVFWELKQAVKILNPQKLLILLDVGVREYDSFRARANSVLDVPLPESTRLRGLVWGFIGFAADWKPRFFALGLAFLRNYFKRQCKYALKPVFESFGLEWQAPPLPVAWLILGGIPLFLLVMVLVVLFLQLFDPL